MMKFLRHPVTGWTKLENKETGRDEAVGKLLLKDMIERKRRNDFVRMREFDMLRKIRKRGVVVGQNSGAWPTSFQSSMPFKPDDRAKTIKKIDDIEAQMSMQWRETEHATTTSFQPVECSNFQPSPTVPQAVSARPSPPL